MSTKDPRDGWEKIEVTEEVAIPNRDGTAIVEKIPVKVLAYRNPRDGEIYLDGHALTKLDDVRARYMGLLLPEQLKDLRHRLDLTQREMSELLQIGEKTYTRWESGRERPSRSLNLLLHALDDGMVTPSYLRLMGDPRLHDRTLPTETQIGAENGSHTYEEGWNTEVDLTHVAA